MTIFYRITSLTNNLTRRHLEWIYRQTVRSPFKIISATILLLVVSGLILLNTRFEADVFRLFPSSIPALRLLTDSLEWTGSAKEAYFLLEGDPGKLPVEAQKLVSRLQKVQFDGKPAFSRVTWRAYDETEGHLFADFVAYAVSHPQLFIAPAETPFLAERLSPISYDAALQRLTSDLAGSFAGMTSSLAVADPLYVRDLILPRLKAASQALNLDPDSPYFRSRDGQMMIVIAEPARPVQDMVFARRLVASINEARQDLDVKVSCAGAHIGAVLDEAAMKSNISACILSSLLVVLAIFYAVYRRLLPTILLPMIIAVGVVLALATASLILPSIHIISFAFMALIIGLGTDYSIHIYDRYHGERVSGKSVEYSVKLAVVETGHGVFTAATTTSLPFLALIVSDVRALYELGLLVGLGVLFSLYATLFFLPPLLIFMEQRSPLTFRPIPPLGFGWVWKAASHHARVIVSCSMCVLAIGVVSAFKTHFDGNLKNLQPRHSEAFLAQEKIEKHLSLSPKQMMVAVEGSNLGDVLDRSGKVGELVERHLAAGNINDWSSLGRVINDSARQREIIRRLSEVASGNKSAVALRASLKKHGFEMEPFRPFIDSLAHFGETKPVPEAEVIARMTASPLRGIVNRHLIHDKSGYHSMVFIYYSGDKFNQTVFIKELALIDPSARATSMDLVSSQLADSVAKSFIWSFLIGGVLVLFLFIAHFESMQGVFCSLFPLAAGAALMLGTMAAFGMGLNFMNAMVLVTIIGMGSDYGLHIGHRVGEFGSDYAEERFVQAGRAVSVSALTTIAGFGSLAFADYPALASIGWATNLGVGFTALFALITLPAIMFIVKRCGTSPPSARLAPPFFTADKLLRDSAIRRRRYAE